MQLFLMALAVAVAEPPPRPMAVEVVRDPITDHVRAYATLRERRNRLVVSCDSLEPGRVGVALHAERWLSRGNFFSGYYPVTYRFDGRRPRRQMWHIDDRHANLTGRSRVIAFLSQLVVAERLAFRTRDIERHRLDLLFHPRGVVPALEQAISACTGRAWSVAELQS